MATLAPIARILFTPPLKARDVATGAMYDLVECSADNLALRSAHAVPSPAMTLKITLAQDEVSVATTGAWRQEQTGLWVASVEPSENNRDQIQDLMGRMRKAQHLQLCETQDVEASDRFTGFDDLQFIPRALPNLDWAELDTAAVFLGQKFNLPILITGMTGGVAQGQQINYRLAAAAQEMRIPMGVGSQRIALENPDLAKIFRVKDAAPGVFLIGNLGSAQVARRDGLDACMRAVEMIDADALAIHLNVVQELVQAEGDRNYADLVERIATVCQKLGKPVIVKEVGSGMDLRSASVLIEAGVAALDIGGRGGTSWGYIEGLRSNDRVVQGSGKVFRNWGIPTAYAVAALLNHAPKHLDVIATGGIRDGVTIAKAVALGANVAGIGLPLMRAALRSADDVMLELKMLEHQLRTTMMATSARYLSHLAQQLAIGQPYQDELKHRVSFLQRGPNSGGG